MKKYVFGLVLLGAMVLGSQSAFASTLTLTPESGAVNSLVTMTWDERPTKPLIMVVGIEDINEGHGGQIRILTLPPTTDGVLQFCFPATLHENGEGGFREVPVTLGAYNVSVATDTVKSQPATFMVTSTTRGDCKKPTDALVPPKRAEEIKEIKEEIKNTITKEIKENKDLKDLKDIKLPVSDILKTRPATKEEALRAFALVNNLSQGVANPQVKELQQYLIKLGLLNTDATGYFGVKTAQAIRLYQKANNLPTTGTFGPRTRAILKQQFEEGKLDIR